METAVQRAQMWCIEFSLRKKWGRIIIYRHLYRPYLLSRVKMSFAFKLVTLLLTLELGKSQIFTNKLVSVLIYTSSCKNATNEQVFSKKNWSKNRNRSLNRANHKMIQQSLWISLIVRLCERSLLAVLRFMSGIHW